MANDLSMVYPPHPMKRVDGQGIPISGVLDGPDWPDDYYDRESGWVDPFRKAMFWADLPEKDRFYIESEDGKRGSIMWRMSTYPYYPANYESWRREWMDHRYVEIDEKGETFWVCHPYHLTAKDMWELYVLEKFFHFRVWVSGDSAYYPGRALRVEIHPPEGGCMPGATPPEPHYVYRMYSADRTLLYVGISKHPWKRFKQHHKQKPWINQVRNVSISEPLPTRAAALEAEAKAIKEEHPVHNIIHNKENHNE